MSAGALDDIARWWRDPVAFVREVFKAEPDRWQADVLAAFPTSPRLAMKACKGPGKTTVMAWLCWNFLATRPHPKIAATSITSDNLADGLWTEMAKWQARSPLLQAAFTWHKTRIEAKREPEAWWMSARTWPRSADANTQADTLAGLHADYLLFILDEAGGIPDAVMAAAEAGLANARGGGGKEAHIVIAGNPTHLEGPLYRACTQEHHLWHVTEVTADPDDPKRSNRVSVEWAREQIQKYGRDNPWVLVNVFGRFPPSSLNSLLGPDEVRDAMQRQPSPDFMHLPTILGVDVAREGDDASAVFRRQGRCSWAPRIFRNINSLQGAGAVSSLWQEHNADACFVDNTGGFGGGWIDQLRVLGYSPTPVHFAGAPLDQRYANKRAEMWFLMAQWIKEGGCLPGDCPELVAELTTPVYFFKGDKLQLEDKTQIKARIGRSVDRADALALTFAHPVYKRTPEEQHLHDRGRKEHDPFDALR